MASSAKISSRAAWQEYLKKAGIPEAEATLYAKALHENRIHYPEDLDKEILKELGITVIGDQIAIMKSAKQSDTPSEKPTHSKTTFAPHIALPRVNAEMTQAEFRKFKTDWSVYKKITKIPDDQMASQLYTACDSAIQTSIVNSVSDLLSVEETELLVLIESFTTRHSNPAVHRLAFSSINQSENEAIKSYLVRLKSSAKDCEFECPSCHHDLSPIHIKDQFIRGLHNTTLQTDILAKSLALKSIEDVLTHAEAFESAVHDQSTLASASQAEAMRISSYKQYSKPGKSYQANMSSLPKTYPGRYSGPQNHKNHQSSGPRQRRERPCRGCGSWDHPRDREKMCPAWNKKCNACGKTGHFESVCYEKQRDIREIRDTSEDGAIISHIELIGDTFTVSSITIQEIPAQLAINGGEPVKVSIFPDSGASICLASTSHLVNLGLKETDLSPCHKKVMAVGGSILTCKGRIEVDFRIGDRSTHQTLYICDLVDRIYFSREGCIDVGILHPSFPYPMDHKHHPTEEIAGLNDDVASNSPKMRSRTLPCPATESNADKLKQHLINEFSSVFTRSTPFRQMNCKPAHIHLKEDAVPYAIHTPIPVPLHWKEQAKADLDRDVTNGIIEPVPVGDPAIWCSPMIIVEKSEGRLRRTIDFQRLNSQCIRETHHVESPFKLASQIPAKKKKTVLDATDGYHAIPLDNESKPLTTFITEWGRYRYRRLPQGFLASGDAYTRRYDDLIKDIPNKIKCVDDVLMWDDDIQSAYFHTFDYLLLCEKNGITINKDKFQFAQDVADFAGLKITSDGIRPSDKLLKAIRDFPTPTDITGARSWFGIVNQIAWAYSNASIMQPFRDLVKPNSKFYWDSTLQKLFEESKNQLVASAIEGIKSFDKSKNTCLQTDWCREGIGYLLLQQHCSCTSDKVPLCCKDGWKLVMAGSRFTKGAEARYSPTEGEALGVAWSLEHARMFVLGCEKLIVSTDHKPLLGLFHNRILSSISNPRLLKLKQRTLAFHFKTKYNPGKWHRGPDGLSRHPTISPVHALFCQDNATSPNTTNVAEDARLEALLDTSDLNMIELERAAAEDPSYRSLLSNVISGFPKTKDLLDPSLNSFWNVKDRLSFSGNLVFLEDRIVIPRRYQSTILNNLHAAHQGVSGMLRRASQSFYWPNLEQAIRNKRYSCKHCNERSPSQQKESYCPSPPPQYPFQEICLDYFKEGHHYYLSCVDRFSGWTIIYHFLQQASARKLVDICRDISTCYGVAETIDSDGGPQFTSDEFKAFLKNWGIRHRISSVDYPQSNGRAELGVKASRRIIMDNTNTDGSLNNDKAARAILQYIETHRFQTLASVQLRYCFIGSSGIVYQPTQHY